MIPKEGVFECPEGLDEDCIIEEVAQDDSLKVLLVLPNDGGGSQTHSLTFNMPPSDGCEKNNSSTMKTLGEWAANHYAIHYGPEITVHVTMVTDLNVHDFKYMIEISPQKIQEKNKSVEECNGQLTHPTSYNGLFDDVVEEVQLLHEEVQLDVEDEKIPSDFEEVEVLNNEVVECDENSIRIEENNDTEENVKIEENNEIEENDKIEENNCEKDVPMKKITKNRESSEMEKHDLSDFKLEFWYRISDSDDDEKDDVAENPSEMEIQIGDSPAITRKSKNGAELLLIYPAPPSRGGISVNTEDYKCLEENIYLNDVIIDFYMKYILLEMLSPADRQRTHIFSSHFFTRLDRSYTEEELGENVSEAEKRHAGVQRWTKNVNIFEKDFVIVPVIEHSHWFLVIICFANLVGVVDDCFISGKEVQRPCLLIFDSLYTKDKLRVANILRSYLTVEYCTKMGDKKIFSKDTLKSTHVKAPHQTNATDCGLYVLQYTESFFKNPILDFGLPFQDLSDWFEQIVIVRKREEIADLITSLAIEFNEDKSVNIPKIKFSKRPTITISDNEDSSSGSRGNSFKALENPHPNVTIRKRPKYRLNSDLFDVQPSLRYKRYARLNGIKKSSSCPKDLSQDASDADSKLIDSDSDSNTFYFDAKYLNNAASTSKSYFDIGAQPSLYYKHNTTLNCIGKSSSRSIDLSQDVLNDDSNFLNIQPDSSTFDDTDATCLNNVASTKERYCDPGNDYTTVKRPLRKAVTRAKNIQQTANRIKEKKCNEDSIFFKKSNASNVHLIESSTSASKFSGTNKLLESSPWISKRNDCSKSFSFQSGIPTDRFYKYSLKNENTIPDFGNLKFKRIKKFEECSDLL